MEEAVRAAKLYLELSISCRGPGVSMSSVVGLPNNSYKPITNSAWVRARFVNYKKGALDLQPHVIKFTSCLPMVVVLSGYSISCKKKIQMLI